MRLGDLDALRDEIDTWGCNDYDKYDFLEAIDKAPTVDITETISKFRNTAYQNGLTTGLNKRPQGEWIHYLGCGIGKAVCSKCGQLGETKKYCGNCGAKMRKGEEHGSD